VRTAAGETVEIRFRADESLLAGCRVEFVERAVDASLAEALAGLRTALSRSFGERAGREEVKAAAAGPGDHDATPPTATESAPATPAQAEPKE